MPAPEPYLSLTLTAVEALHEARALSYRDIPPAIRREYEANRRTGDLSPHSWNESAEVTVQRFLRLQATYDEVKALYDVLRLEGVPPDLRLVQSRQAGTRRAG